MQQHIKPNMEQSTQILRELLNSVSRLDLDLHVAVQPADHRSRRAAVSDHGSLLYDEQESAKTAITIKVLKRKGELVVYKLNKSTPLRLLMLDYCQRKGLVYGQVRFGFDGRLIRETQTPQVLGIVDEDVINA